MLERLKTTDYEKHIKYYPGSKKGPLPSDDPDHYSNWFMQNIPEEIIWPDGNVDYRDIGVKYQTTWKR